MRLRFSVFAFARYAVALGVIAGSVALVSADRKASFSPHDKAYYADPSVIEYVQPGLAFSVVSASIASNGTVTVDYKVTDSTSTGAALDQAGVTTPGPISPRFVLGYIAKGSTQFTSYWSSSSTNATTGFVSTRASGDTGGTTQTVAVGEYIYTFGNKVPTTFDATVTNRLGIYGSRNLTTWNLGTSYADTTYDFVPNGSKVTVTRDVVRTASCNQCHDSLSFHGGSRRSVQLCVICHQPQTNDTNGNSADFKVMVHKIHMGSQLPSVVAGGAYALGSTDWSTVVLPSNPERCTFCHQSTATAGATQPDNWKTNPSRAACGSCHDDVNFATGLNHVNLPQANDAQCTQCHQPTGTEFDASITGAHTIPTESASAPGINLAITKVTNGVSGKAPTVTFTIKDNSGAAIPMSAMTGGSNRLALVMAGPASDYGYTSFGADVTTPGYVSENPVPTASCGSDGTCTYTFTHAVPAKATGTYAIGIEGRRGLTLEAGTVIQQTTEYGAINKVFYFSVDGSPVTPRRTVVSVNNCNNCHARLSLHGENRNQIEMCVLCHNPTENDSFGPVQRDSSVGQGSATAERELRAAGSQDPYRREPGQLQPDLHRGGIWRQPQRLFGCALPGDESLGRGSRHHGLRHVPRERLGIGSADRQKRGSGPAGPVEPVAGHHRGLHGVPPEHLGVRARGAEHQLTVRRELPGVPWNRRGLRSHPGARRPVVGLGRPMAMARIPNGETYADSLFGFRGWALRRGLVAGCRDGGADERG